MLEPFVTHRAGREWHTRLKRNTLHTYFGALNRHHTSQRFSASCNPLSLFPPLNPDRRTPCALHRVASCRISSNLQTLSTSAHSFPSCRSCPHRAEELGDTVLHGCTPRWIPTQHDRPFSTANGRIRMHAHTSSHCVSRVDDRLARAGGRARSLTSPSTVRSWSFRPPFPRSRSACCRRPTNQSTCAEPCVLSFLTTSR